MGKAPASQFYWGDWRKDVELHMMSWDCRGVWMEMLTCMWEARERGKLEGTDEQLCRLLGCSVEILKKTLHELSVTKTGDVTVCNDLVTVINRRMYREEKSRILTRSRVKRFREKEMTRESNENITRLSSSSSSSSKERNNKRKKVLPVTDEQWLTDLKANPAYSQMDIDREFFKMDAWLSTHNGKKKTKRFIVNWLNRAEKPIETKPDDAYSHLEVIH